MDPAKHKVQQNLIQQTNNIGILNGLFCIAYGKFKLDFEILEFCKFLQL